MAAFSLIFQNSQYQSDVPTLSIEKADLILTYTCGVCVDVDNTFDANAPVDDNKTFVLGTTLSGVELPLPSTAGQPIQQVKLHVLTPGLHGRNNVTFTIDPADVSHYSGLAMNYPITSPDSTPDMGFGNGSLSVTVRVPSSGDTIATLNIYDYAASATVTVTAPTPTGDTITYRKKIPRDNDGNGLPDGGWTANGSTMSDDGMPATDDLDSDPAATGTPYEGLYGDGLTALEEYRGFVIGTQHVRLDPNHRDLFIVADASILASPVLAPAFWTTLPHALHYLAGDEVLAQSSPDPAIDGTSPVVNPNRSGISGALPQRAVRVRSRIATPLFHNDLTLEQWPAEVRVKAYTWVDGEDLRTIHWPSTLALQTPNGTQVVDYPPGAFANDDISYGANGIRDTIADKTGQPLVPCADSAVDIGCVMIDDVNQLISRPSLEYTLFAAAAGDDMYTRVSFADCTFTTRTILSQSEFNRARTVTAAHELAHALSVPHSQDCATAEEGPSLMFSSHDETRTPADISVIDVLPLPTEYARSIIERMRLHANQ